VLEITETQLESLSIPALVFYARKLEALKAGISRFKVAQEEYSRTRDWMDRLKKAEICSFIFHRDTGEYEMTLPDFDLRKKAASWIDRIKLLDPSIKEVYPKLGAAEYTHFLQLFNDRDNLEDDLTEAILAAKNGGIPARNLMKWISIGLTKRQNQPQDEAETNGGFDHWKHLAAQTKKQQS
jgi:hypothetical protein